jgi:ABC-type uncharacterized transport system involved in gliding motility auxiliary subunit
MPRKIYGATGLIIALVLLLSINMLANAFFRSTQLDLTESKLYTISEGTKNILKDLNEPIKLRLYFSQKETSNLPALANYGRRVKELLQEYDRLAGDNIELEIIDPVPFTEEEDQAVSAGIQGLPITQTSFVYLGVEGVNTTEGREVIPFLTPERGDFLEYDLTSMIDRLNNPAKKKLTIISSLPMDGSAVSPMERAMGRQGGEPWVIYSTLQRQYDVQFLDKTATAVPEDTDVLMVVHPKDFSEALKYSIDQFIVAGGNAMLFVDPKADVEQPEENPQNPMQSMFAPKDSNLPEILKSLGLELEADKLAGDRAQAQQVQAGSQTRPELVDFVLYIGLKGESLNPNEVPTANLETVNVGYAGILKKLEGATTTVTPILQTSETSERIDLSAATPFPDAKKLFQEFKSLDEQLMIAAQVQGKIKSAYPDGPAEGEKSPNHLTEGTENATVLVVADVDMLSDNFWVRVQSLLGQRLMMPFADNGNMILNYAEFFAGNENLISIRGRADSTRPFTRIQEIEKDAQAKFAEREQELQKKLEETQQRLNQLQNTRQDEGGSNQFFLTEEQQQEIEKFREEQVETRKELRRVQANLRTDVEQLITQIKFINIGLIPLLVGIVAVGMGIFRHRRRRSH